MVSQDISKSHLDASVVLTKQIVVNKQSPAFRKPAPFDSFSSPSIRCVTKLSSCAMLRFCYASVGYCDKCQKMRKFLGVSENVFSRHSHDTNDIYKE